MSTRAPDEGVSDEHLIELFVSGKSYGAVAASVGLSKATVYQRLQKPACKAAIEQHREEALKAARGVLRQRSTDLARRLVNIGLGRKKGTPEQVRAIISGLRLAGLDVTKHIEVSGGLRHLSNQDLDAEERKLAAALGTEEEG